MAAAFIRPTVFGQSCISLPAKRAFASTSGSIRSFAVAPLRQVNNALVQKQPRTLGGVSKDMRVATAAAFHSSAKRDILPPGPQVIEGTTNDAHPVPDPDPMHGSYHWTMERAVALGLVPLTVAPFAAGTLNPTLDAVFIGAILIHSHIGFQSVVIDYIPSKRFPRAKKLFWWGLHAATLSVAVGFYEFETHDVGVTEAVKRIWKA